MTPVKKGHHMHPVLAFFSRLPKKLTALIPLSMVLGLGAGVAFDLSALKVAILPLTMLMVYPMLVNFRPAEALDIRRGGRALWVAMALDFLVMPLLAWLLARLFFSGDPAMFVGLLLIGIFPTSGMTISWTGFAKGNVGAAVKMTVFGLLGAAVLAPVYLVLLAGATVDVDVLGVARTVLLVVVVPLVAGVLTRRGLERKMGQEAYRERVAKAFPGMSVVGVLAIVFLALGLKARMIVYNPDLLIGTLLPLALFYVAAYAIATLVGRALLSRDDAVAAVYGSVMRNLSIALGVAIASFGPEAALVLAVAYVFQVQSAAWYVRLADRLLGSRGRFVFSRA
jgi:ACR3 family arsenite efflux pump ArsB